MTREITPEQLDLFNNTKKKQIVISGSSGMIGVYLTKFFQNKGYKVKSIPRKAFSAIEILKKVLEETDIVINLAGESIANGFWTKKKKQRIYNSRINTTTTLVDVMSHMKNPPSLFISASGVGYYGADAKKIDNEEQKPGNDFLAKVCIDWEISAKKYLKGRVVITRFGIVISKTGGFLKRLQLLAKLFLLGFIGTGTQMISWISIEDIAAFFLKCIEEENIIGTYNLTTPKPISNKECITAIAKSVKRPVSFTLPTPLVKIFLGEKGVSLLLSDQSVFPKKLLNSKFLFQNEEFSSYLISKK